MTALAADASNLSAHGNALEFVREAYAGKTALYFYQGAAVGRDPDDSNLIKPLAAAKPFYSVTGVNCAGLVGHAHEPAGDEPLHGVPRDHL